MNGITGFYRDFCFKHFNFVYFVTNYFRFSILVKNADGNSERVKGKQSALADIFATAWAKGMAEIEVNLYYK